MKKHCWEIRSSPHEVKVFFRNPTLNSQFKSRFFLFYLQFTPSTDGFLLKKDSWNRQLHERNVFYIWCLVSSFLNLNLFIIPTNYAVYGNSIFLFHQQSNVRKATNTVKGCNLIGILDFRNRALVFSFPTNFLKTTAEVCCKEYNQLIDRVWWCMCLWVWHAQLNKIIIIIGFHFRV